MLLWAKLWKYGTLHNFFNLAYLCTDVGPFFFFFCIMIWFFFQTLVQLATHFYLYLIWLFLIHFHFLLLYPVFIVSLFCFSAFSVFHYQISDVYLSLDTKERIIKSNRYHWYTRYVVTGNFKLFCQQYFMHFFQYHYAMDM